MPSAISCARSVIQPLTLRQKWHQAAIAVGRREIRIELDRLVEQRQPFADGLPGALIQVRPAAQIVVVGVEALGRLALGALDLRPLELRRDRADDARGHLILQLEDIVERAFEAVRPEMRRGRSVDELPGDAHPVRRLAHAAFQHVAHAQFAADLPHVDRAALVGEAGVARDDEQPAHARQRRDDVLHHAVGEVLLLGIAAQVQERQDGDRGLVGKGQRLSRTCHRVLAMPGVGDLDVIRDCISLTSPMNRKPLRASVRIRRCSSPLSPIALRAALM